MQKFRLISHVGDKALIPLVIKNNSGENLEITIDIDTPGKFRIGNYNNNIVLSADSSQQVLIPLEATVQVKGTVHFVIKNQFGKETISLPVSVADKGFPVIETFSGNKTQQHSFTINKMIRVL
jgi:uncharacterized protein YfaS (alpha-2-macroglobulin family)